MARVTHVERAQQRFETKPIIDPATGEQKVIPILRRDGTPKKDKRGKEIVRRVTVNDLTKPLPNHTCGKCGVEIKVGDPYKWIKPKSGPYGGSKRYRCEKCPSWRPSETTSSSALASIYGAQEAAEDALNAWDGEDIEDVRSILEECASGVREGAECWRESANNMEEGFGHATYQSDELNEKADNADASADEIEQTDLEEFDEDAARVEHEEEVLAEYVSELESEEGITANSYTLEEATAAFDDFDTDEYERRVEEAVEAAKVEWADGIREAAADAVGNVDF